MEEKKVAECYFENAIEKQTKRIKEIREKFCNIFHTEPSHYIRAPGRVNLIGEHVDYSGYSVLPMAIEGDAIIGISQRKWNEDEKRDENVLTLRNFEERFSLPSPFALSDILENNEIFSKHEWQNYMFAASQGFAKSKILGTLNNGETITMKEALKSLFDIGPISMLVHGTVPIGSGLSSSASMVCAYTLSFATLLLHKNIIHSPISREDIAECSAKSEMLVGVESGGMDQAISLLGKKNFALFISFRPKLSSSPIPLPSVGRFVLLNSLVEHNVQSSSAGTGYNVRVVECRLAAALLAKLTILPSASSIRTLSDFQSSYFQHGENIKINEEERSPEELLNCLQLVKEKLTKEFYSVNEICEILEVDFDQSFREKYLGSVVDENILEKLKLRDRANHVFSEAKRVFEFAKICNSNIENNIAIMNELGSLMSDSHSSCRSNFECSCLELDYLVENCVKAGARGARLTGAGWGGWCIALVDQSTLPKFLEDIWALHYREKLGENLSSKYVIVTQPGDGACFFTDNSF